MLSRVLEVSTFLPMKQAKSQPSTAVWCVLLYLLAVLWGLVPVPIRLYAAKVSPFRMHVQMNISIYFCHQSVTKRGWPFICFFFFLPFLFSMQFGQEKKATFAAQHARWGVSSPAQHYEHCFYVQWNGDRMEGWWKQICASYVIMQVTNWLMIECVLRLMEIADPYCVVFKGDFLQCRVPIMVL